MTKKRINWKNKHKSKLVCLSFHKDIFCEHWIVLGCIDYKEWVINDILWDYYTKVLLSEYCRNVLIFTVIFFFEQSYFVHTIQGKGSECQ